MTSEVLKRESLSDLLPIPGGRGGGQPTSPSSLLAANWAPARAQPLYNGLTRLVWLRLGLGSARLEPVYHMGVRDRVDSGV